MNSPLPCFVRGARPRRLLVSRLASRKIFRVAALRRNQCLEAQRGRPGDGYGIGRVEGVRGIAIASRNDRAVARGRAGGTSDPIGFRGYLQLSTVQFIHVRHHMSLQSVAAQPAAQTSLRVHPHLRRVHALHARVHRVHETTQVAHAKLSKGRVDICFNETVALPVAIVHEPLHVIEGDP